MSSGSKWNLNQGSAIQTELLHDTNLLNLDSSYYRRSTTYTVKSDWYTHTCTLTQCSLAIILTTDESSCYVKLANRPGETAGNHAHPTEKASHHNSDPAAKPLHQDAAEGPWKWITPVSGLEHIISTFFMLERLRLEKLKNTPNPLPLLCVSPFPL